MRRACTLLVLLLGCNGPDPAGQFALLSGPLQSPQPALSGAFGISVAFAGALAVIGAPGESEGAVYLFDPATLQLFARIQSPLPEAGGQYGAAVAANSFLMAIGEPHALGNSGRAFLHEAPTTAVRLIFVSVNPETGGAFGSSVAVSQTNVAVGAPFEDAKAQADSGRAYYFDCLTNTALQTFESPNLAPNGHFGCAVATVNFDVFVGACDEGPGRLYGFDGLTGLLVRSFDHPNAFPGARFGAALATFGGGILVGAPGQGDAQFTKAGAVYLIDRASGQLIHTFTSPNPGSGNSFGASVAASGNSIFIGEPLGQQGVGAAYEFDGTTFALIATYGSTTPETGGGFGGSVAAVVGNMIVGAPVEDAGAIDAGRAYLNPTPQ